MTAIRGAPRSKQARCFFFFFFFDRTSRVCRALLANLSLGSSVLIGACVRDVNRIDKNERRERSRHCDRDLKNYSLTIVKNNCIFLSGLPIDEINMLDKTFLFFLKQIYTLFIHMQNQ